MAKSKHSLGQMVASVRESIQERWNSMHDHVATPAQRKDLRAEISDAVASLGKTIKQYDPRKSKAKKSASKKSSAAKRQASPKKASTGKRKSVTPMRGAKKTDRGKRS